MHDLLWFLQVHSHLAPRQTSLDPFESLIRAAGLPEMYQALTFSTTDKVFFFSLHKLCTTPPSWLVLMTALGLVEAICGATHAQHDTT